MAGWSSLSGPATDWSSAFVIPLCRPNGPDGTWAVPRSNAANARSVLDVTRIGPSKSYVALPGRTQSRADAGKPQTAHGWDC